MTRDEPVDIGDLVAALCDRFGLDKDYVSQIEVNPGDINFVLLHGSEGRCKGRKAVDRNHGEASVLMTHERHLVRT